WYRIWEALTERFTVLAFDFLGFGFSDKPKRHPYALIEQADISAALIRHFDIQTYHLLVHDYGVSVAQELLARQAEGKMNGIQSVCFLNGGLFPSLHHPRPIQRALISPLGFMLVPFLSKSMLRKNFHEVFGKDTPPSDWEVDQFYALMEHKGGKYIFHRLIRYMADRKQYGKRWRKAILEASIPIRLINGAQDPVSGKHLAEYYQSVATKPDVVILDDYGHYPQTEAPEVVLEHFFHFINLVQ
ncbi:MAG: alpha/beta hydrolase, partial [Bacteroidota bacterium]